MVFIPAGPGGDRGCGKVRPLWPTALEHCVGCLDEVSRSPVWECWRSCPALWLCPGVQVSTGLLRRTSPSRDPSGLSPSTEVSWQEAWQGQRLRLLHPPGSAHQHGVGVVWSQRRGTVCSAWWGGMGSSGGWSPEGERTVVTGTCLA